MTLSSVAAGTVGITSTFPTSTHFLPLSVVRFRRCRRILRSGRDCIPGTPRANRADRIARPGHPQVPSSKGTPRTAKSAVQFIEVLVKRGAQERRNVDKRGHSLAANHRHDNKRENNTNPNFDIRRLPFSGAALRSAAQSYWNSVTLLICVNFNTASRQQGNVPPCANHHAFGEHLCFASRGLDCHRRISATCATESCSTKPGSDGPSLTEGITGPFKLPSTSAGLVCFTTVALSRVLHARRSATRCSRSGLSPE